VEETLMSADIIVFARDYPEVRLVAEVKRSALDPPDFDRVVKQAARYMWGWNCHYGLIFTPETTYLLREDFTAHGPESIRLSGAFPTERLLARLVVQPGKITSERELASLARDWLERLAASYETALPDDPEVTSALFPEVVGAVADGRVMAEVAAR
jgi:hypothetical protein